MESSREWIDRSSGGHQHDIPVCAAADKGAESEEEGGTGTVTGLLKSGSSMCSSILRGHRAVSVSV